MAQLITGSGGYAATVGGTVRVIGSNDVDVISLADIAGKISFDGSFNRGGDFIVLPNAAKAYSIVRASSSITLSDADSTITIPVGSKGTTLQFADGELILKFDGQIMIGSQIVTTASAAITAALSTKTALPTATSASGTLLMAPDEPVTVGGNVRVVGTNGSDTVTVADVAGNISFDGSFNRGGDKIVVGKFAENYSAARPNASNVTIGDSDTKLTIPLGSKGLSVQFGNEARNLIYSNSSAYLGNQNLVAEVTKLSTLEANIKFKPVENAFRGDLPFPRTQAVSYAAIDINRDGFKDIVFAFWTGVSPENLGKNVGDAPTENKVKIYINKNGQYFEDETKYYLIGSDDLGGTTRKIEIVDLNSDGLMDLIFATNREDGRSADMDSTLSALISSNGKYIVQKFGVKDIYHSVGSGTIDNKVFVAGSGFRGLSPLQGGFSLKGETFINDVDINVHLSPNTFIFFSSNENPNTTNLIQTQVHPNLLGVEGWVYDGMQWVSAGKIDNPFEFVKNVQVFQFNGEDSGLIPVYKFGAQYILGGGGYAITESSVIDIMNNNENSVVMKMELPIIKDFNEKITEKVYLSTDIINSAKLIFFTIKDGILIKLDNYIDGEIIEYNNYNHMDVFDINKDGYDDIITSPYNSDGNPNIYINQRDGSFKIFNFLLDKRFNEYGGTGASLIADFNLDGILDIVTFPANGSNPSLWPSMETFKYYQGANSIVFG
jgi:hypothetical protein